MKNFLTNSLGGRLASFAILSALVFAPIAYAQDNDNKGKDNKAKEHSSLQQRLANFANGIIVKDKDKNEHKDALKENAFEVRMAGNGEVTVRGAKITAINGGTVTAVTTLLNTSLTWTVLTDGSTNFVTKGGKNTALSGLKVGDSVSFSGKLASSGAAFTVNAKVLKNWSAVPATVPARHVFEGKLSALVATTLPTSLTLTIGGKTYTAIISTGTEILNSVWATTTLSRFSIGDTIRVFGSIQADNSTTIDAYVIRDASLR